MLLKTMDTDNIQDEKFKNYRKNGSGDYLFVLFKSSAYVFANGAYCEVGPGNAILFSRTGFQEYFPVENKVFIHDFMHFEPQTEAENQLIGDIPTDTVLNIVLPKRISDVLDAIKAEQNFANPYQSEVLSTLGILFLYSLKSELSRDVRIVEKRVIYGKLHALKNEIYNMPEKAWSVDYAAKQVVLSESYFKHVYRELMGCSFMQDVIAARLLKAKMLLKSTDISMLEISIKCGYASIEHFTRQFKKYVGTSPNQFRSL